MGRASRLRELGGIRCQWKAELGVGVVGWAGLGGTLMDEGLLV